jgi:uncharacterized protein (UPF0261 family)
MGGQPEISSRFLKAYVVGTIDTMGEELSYVRDAIEAMAQAFSNFLPSRQDIGGFIGLGGSGGPAIITPALQTLQIGVPKIRRFLASKSNAPSVISVTSVRCFPIHVDLARELRASTKDFWPANPIPPL